MLCTVWCPLHGFGRAIARWNGLVMKIICARAFFVCTRRAPTVRKNRFLQHEEALNGCFESSIANMNC